MLIDIIAYTAGILLMISFLPQLILTIRDKNVEDLSLAMVIISALSSLLYIVYAYSLGLTPVVVMNTIFLLSAILLIILIIKYKK